MSKQKLLDLQIQNKCWRQISVHLSHFGHTDTLCCFQSRRGLYIYTSCRNGTALCSLWPPYREGHRSFWRRRCRVVRQPRGPHSALCVNYSQNEFVTHKCMSLSISAASIKQVFIFLNYLEQVYTVSMRDISIPELFLANEKQEHNQHSCNVTPARRNCSCATLRSTRNQISSTNQNVTGFGFALCTGGYGHCSVRTLWKRTPESNERN